MFYSNEALDELQADYRAILRKSHRLSGSYAARNFNNRRAKEFATHGFVRRLQVLVHCIDQVFSILPPDRSDLPTRDNLADATISIHAFVFNVFGSIDNLAWIWVHEKNVRRDDGSQIPNSWIGLSKDHRTVRASLSPEFRQYLDELVGWLDHIEDFRHALAHRIPLYIPPYVVPDDKLQAYHEFEPRLAEALSRNDFATHDRLFDEQRALGDFRPYMTHSFEENAGIVRFHPQMLADFNTIEALGARMLQELDR